jgi:cytochrome c-type biogenesis protein CcmE
VKKRWPLIAAVLVAVTGFALITAGGIGDNLIYYWTPSDLRAAGDKAYGAPIRLGGMVAEGTLVSHPSSADVRFTVTDGKTTIAVRTRGVPPQMFREGIGVVVEGTMSRQGWFDGKRLMVSHDNKYEPPKDHPKGV